MQQNHHWLIFVAAVAVLCLLVPGAGFAQHESSQDNQVGLFLNPDGTGATFTDVIDVPVSVYLVLINPADVENDDAPYATINAFECMLNFVGPIPFLLGVTLPPTGTNTGDDSDINNGFLEYIVGVDTPLDVTAGSATLISFQFIVTNPGITEIALVPTNVPSIPGMMAFKSASSEFQIMSPASGPSGDYVFCFNDCVGLPLEGACFGSVKALYR